MAETQMPETQQSLSDTQPIETLETLLQTLQESQPSDTQAAAVTLEKVDLSFFSTEYMSKMTMATGVREAYEIICLNPDKKHWIPLVVEIIMADMLDATVICSVNNGRLLKDVLIDSGLDLMDKYVPTIYEDRSLFFLEMLVRNVLMPEKFNVAQNAWRFEKKWLDTMGLWERAVLGAQHVYTYARLTREEEERKRAREPECQEQVKEQAPAKRAKRAPCDT